MLELLPEDEGFGPGRDRPSHCNGAGSVKHCPVTMSTQADFAMPAGRLGPGLTD